MAKKEIRIFNQNYEYPRPNKKEVDPTLLYKENTFIPKREVVLDVTLSPKGQLKEIDKCLDIIKTKCKILVVDFLQLKLYKYTARIDDDYKISFLSLEKYLKVFRNEIDVVSKVITSSYDKTTLNVNELEFIQDKVESLFGFQTGLRNDYNELKKKYYRDFKVSSFNVIRNKTIEEIESHIKLVEEELYKYKSIEVASDFYIYNSGVLINEVINEIVKIVGVDNKLINYHYFSQQDAILAFRFPDWLDLFVKFNYVLPKIKERYVESSEFLKKYQTLEVRYSILSIQNEM